MPSTPSTGSKRSKQPTSATRGLGRFSLQGSSRFSLLRQKPAAADSAVPSHHSLAQAHHLVPVKSSAAYQGERKTSEGAGGSSAAGTSSSVKPETYDDERAALYDHPVARFFGKKPSSESGAPAGNDDDTIEWQYHPARNPLDPPQSTRSRRRPLRRWNQNRNRDAQEEKISTIPEDAPVQPQQNLPSAGGNFFTDAPTGHDFLAAPSITRAAEDISDNDGFTQSGSTLTPAFAPTGNRAPTVDPRTSFPGFTDRNIRAARGFRFNNEL